MAKKEEGKGKKLTFSIEYEVEQTEDGADINFSLKNSEEDRLFAYMVTLWDLSHLLDKAMEDERAPDDFKKEFLTAARILKEMTSAAKLKVEEKLGFKEKLSIIEKLKQLFKEVEGENGESLFPTKGHSSPSKIVLGGDIPEEIREELEKAIKEQFGDNINIDNMSKEETLDFLDKNKTKITGAKDEVDFDDLDQKNKKDDSSEIEM